MAGDEKCTLYSKVWSHQRYVQLQYGVPTFLFKSISNEGKHAKCLFHLTFFLTAHFQRTVLPDSSVLQIFLFKYINLIRKIYLLNNTQNNPGIT